MEVFVSLHWSLKQARRCLKAKERWIFLDWRWT